MYFGIVVVRSVVEGVVINFDGVYDIVRVFCDVVRVFCDVVNDSGLICCVVSNVYVICGAVIKMEVIRGVVIDLEVICGVVYDAVGKNVLILYFFGVDFCRTGNKNGAGARKMTPLDDDEKRGQQQRQQ